MAQHFGKSERLFAYHMEHGSHWRREIKTNEIESDENASPETEIVHADVL